jgi:NADH-quinone oxidoreductase subunit H
MARSSTLNLGDGSLLLWAAVEPNPLLTWHLWLWLLIGFGAVFPGIVAYMVWAERKAAARFQDRIGPNRVGPLGLLQPIADALKLITKEDIVPRAADRVVHILAPVLLLISAMLALAVIPFGFGSVESRPDPTTGAERGVLTGLVAVDLPSGLLYLIAVSSLSSLGIFLAGWSSRNKYALLGSMRSVAQLVSYEVPQVLSTVPVILWAGSLSLVTIMSEQVDTGWFIASPPGVVAFVTLLIASIAEVNRTPFDLPEAESEIIAGFHTEYSSMRFGLFFLAEYMSVFGISCLAALLFLGGGAIPFTDFPKDIGTGTAASWLLVNAITVGVFALKVGFFIFVFFWVRATLPRMRVDRLMNFAWKFLVPLSIANIPIAAVWLEMVIKRPIDYRWWFVDGTWLLGVLVTGILEVLAIGLLYGIYRMDAEATPTGPGIPATGATPARVAELAAR